MAKSDDSMSGFSKITDGLADLLNLLTNLNEGGDLPHRGRREKNGMVVEYSVGHRTMDGSRAEPPPKAAEKKTRQRTQKPTHREVVEPVTDVFDEADETVILFEVPGADLSAIHCTLSGDILLLDAATEGRLFHKEVLIEAELTHDKPRLRLHNGILEVRLTKKS